MYFSSSSYLREEDDNQNTKRWEEYLTSGPSQTDRVKVEIVIRTQQRFKYSMIFFIPRFVLAYILKFNFFSQKYSFKILFNQNLAKNIH